MAEIDSTDTTSNGSLIPTGVTGLLAGFEQTIYDTVGKAFDASKNSLNNLVDLGVLGDWAKAFLTEQINDKPPFSNILSSYASYNYIFTLSVIDDDSLNFPNETYKQGDIGQILLRSGSTDANNRVYIDNYGTFEFYIEDIDIDSVIGFQRSTGNTNMCSIHFKVIEPYSMGMFFIALQAAASRMGHFNYTTAPFLLTLQFKGHVNAEMQGVSGDALSSSEKTTRHFPIRLMDIDMKVSSSGSEYTMSAVPYNQLAMASSIAEIKGDISIVGKTVHELLQTGEQSLQVVLNKKLQDLATQQKLASNDQVLIYFPSDPSSGASEKKFTDDFSKITAAINPSSEKLPSITQKLKVSIPNGGNGTLVQKTSDMNPIGKASMGFDSYKQGDQPFAKDNLVYDPKTHVYSRGNMTIESNVGNMKFTQNTSIINIINQVVIMSDIGRQALSEKQVAKDGKITWWRIDTQVYNMSTDGNIGTTGSKPKLYVYRVLPYKVDSSIFLPNDKVNPYIAKARENAIKEYNYIYTGLNTEVIDFEMQYKNAFYIAMNANVAMNSSDNRYASKYSDIAQENSKTVPQTETVASKIFGNLSKLEKKVVDTIFETKYDKTTSSNSNKGGAGLNSKESILAKEAHDIIISGGKDMIKPKLKILGDPYYIADSGIGNYTAIATQYQNISADHSMDYQTGEVDIIVNFRTPLDINVSLSTYNFNDGAVLSQFSGLYQVLRVTSNFSKGKFTQELDIIRRDGQS
jgi:hypothetical protein